MLLQDVCILGWLDMSDKSCQIYILHQHTLLVLLLLQHIHDFEDIASTLFDLSLGMSQQHSPKEQLLSLENTFQLELGHMRHCFHKFLLDRGSAQ